jgi:acyl-homoserine lactone acylase PvdQ
MNKAEENKWCKIFQIGDRQILIAKNGYNEEDDAYEITLTAFIDGAKISMTLGHVDEKKSSDLFDQYSEEMAEAWLEGTVLPLFENADEEE